MRIINVIALLWIWLSYFSAIASTPLWEVGNPWSLEERKNLYKADRDAHWLGRAFSSFVDNTPGIWEVHFLNFGFNDKAKEIASACLHRHPGQTWRSLACVSQLVHTSIALREVKIPEYVTGCQAFAWAFKLAVDELKLPGIKIGLADGSTPRGGPRHQQHGSDIG